MLSTSAALLAGLLVASTVTPVLTIRDADIDESSGLVRSVRHPSVLWTHNDGGSTAEIYGINAKGRTVAQITLRGVDPYDPEALSRGVDIRRRPALFLGDIGDNGERRRNVSVFRIAEPKSLGRQTIRPTWFRFRYKDGPHDAEALLVDPRDGRIWIATKAFGTGGLYRGPLRLVDEKQGTNVLRRVADVPALVTDGTFLPDGKFVLRTYTSAFLYDAPGKLREQLTVPAQAQGESVAYDGKRLLLGSEGKNSKVVAVPLPDVGNAAPAPEPSSASNRPSIFRGSEGLQMIQQALIVAVAMSLLVLIVARLRRDR